MHQSIDSKGLKVNLQKTKVVVSGAQGEVSVSKVDPCGICGKWSHGRFVKVKRVTLRLGRDFVCGRC